MTYRIAVQVPRQGGAGERVERRAVDPQLVAEPVARLDVVNHGVPHRSVLEKERNGTSALYTDEREEAKLGNEPLSGAFFICRAINHCAVPSFPGGTSKFS